MWQFPNTPTPISLSGMPANAWQTLHCGAPVGSSGAIIVITGNSTMGGVHTRSTGSPDNFTATAAMAGTGGTIVYKYVGLSPSSDQFDLWSTMTATTQYQAWLFGYTGAETHYFQTDSAKGLAMQSLTPPVINTWVDFDVSSYCPANTVGVIGEQISGYQFDVREFGSSNVQATPSAGTWDFVIGVAPDPAVPGSLKFQVRRGSSTMSLYVKAYITGGYVPNANLVGMTIPATVVGWNQVTASQMPTPGIGYFLRTPGVSSQCNLATYPVRPAQQPWGHNWGIPVPGPDFQWNTTTAGTTSMNVLGTLVTGATTPPTTAKGFLNIRTTSQP